MYFDGRRPTRPEAFPEPPLQQTIEDLCPVGDHVNRHIPGGLFAADHRRRLMIADEHHHEVAVRAKAKIATKRNVNVVERLRITRPEIEPVGLLCPGAGQFLIVIRGGCEDSAPVRLVRRGRCERRVRADRGEEDEHRLAGAWRNLEGVHPSERELIGNVPPPE